LPPIDFRDPAVETLRPYRQPLLARERLRSHHDAAAKLLLSIQENPGYPHSYRVLAAC
jgi:hypothetical protein